MRSSEPLDYISGEDVMTIYKVKKSWLYASAKRNSIPMCKIAGKNYYSRKHMDALFGVSAEIEALTEWLTTEEAEALYSTTKESLRTQAYRRHIPTKREYGKTYYSKIHLDEVYHPDLKASDDYYTTTEAAEKYPYQEQYLCYSQDKQPHEGESRCPEPHCQGRIRQNNGKQTGTIRGLQAPIMPNNKHQLRESTIIHEL